MGLTVSWSEIIRYTKDNVIKNVSDEKGGIYRLLIKNENNEGFIVFYVGRGKSLYGRLLDHLSYEEKNNCIKQKLNSKCYFQFAYVSDSKHRACAERFMYDTYSPDCNTNAPDSEPCEINLK